MHQQKLAMTLADPSCKALGWINEMDRQGTVSLYTEATAVSGLPMDQGARPTAAYVSTPSLLSGLPPFASPATYHGTNTTLLGGSTAAAAITLGPRLRLQFEMTTHQKNS